MESVRALNNDPIDVLGWELPWVSCNLVDDPDSWIFCVSRSDDSGVEYYTWERPVLNPTGAFLPAARATLWSEGSLFKRDLFFEEP